MYYDDWYVWHEWYDRPATTLATAIERAESAESQVAELSAALQLTAGALQTFERGNAIINFTGRWSHLGKRTITSILDDANKALEPSKETASNDQ